MENNLLHPSKCMWVKVVFKDELTPEQRDERQMQIWQRLKSDMRPIIGTSQYLNNAEEFIRPSQVDFIVVGCRKVEEGSNRVGIEVLIQYWDDLEENPDLSTGDVMFTFLTRDGLVLDVNYATLRPRGLVDLKTWW